MSKIVADHLAREAVVYVRQSTPGQLRHNGESRRRQYGLRNRARGLGWREPVVIDEDLGRSGGGTSRPGFDRLLVAICEGRVGIVLSLEASRLARNGGTGDGARTVSGFGWRTAPTGPSGRAVARRGRRTVTF